MSKPSASLTAQVVASGAHDLRSPLNAVIGFSRLMLKGIDGPLSDMQSTDLQAIHTNGHALLFMLDALIDLARAEARWSEPNAGPWHVHLVLQRLCTLNRPAAQEGPIGLIYDADDVLPAAWADQEQVQKALQRSLAALMHLVGAGRITLTAQQEGSWIVVRAAAQADAQLSPETAQTLDAFASGGTSHEQRVNATALALLAARQLILLNGGQLELDRRSETEIALTVHLARAPSATSRRQT